MKIFYGPKGSGKTKSIIDCANQLIDKAKGHILFVTDNSRNTLEIKSQIRFIDVSGFEIQGVDGFRGFVKGLVAANGDNEYIFIDGISRITAKAPSELETIFSAMDKLEKDYDVNFVLTVSANKEDLPLFVQKYID